jgi:hypothetical protein
MTYEVKMLLLADAISSEEPKHGGILLSTLEG